MDESGTGTIRNPGFAPTTGVLNSPANLAIDALGNLYIIHRLRKRRHR